MAKKWVVEAQSLIPQGQLGEILMIARLDTESHSGEYLEAKMCPMGRHGDFPLPVIDSPLASFGAGSFEPFLQAIMDYAWKRGLRPTKFDPHLADIGVREDDKSW